MESAHSDLARAAVEVSAAAAAAAANPDLASAGAGKGNKNRAFSQAFILASELPQVAVTLAETTGACTVQKKAKIQSTHTSGEHSSSKIVGRQEQERGWFDFLKWNREGNRREEIDGLDRDDDKLAKEIDGCLRQLKDNPFVYLGGRIDVKSFTILDEQQQRELDRRLALCRIRAYEETYRHMDDAELLALFPAKDLDDKEYFLNCEYSFEWYFDRVYCQYADFQDYQRLVLRNRNNVCWEFYRSTCSTLEGDLAYIQFWEKLTSTTQLIEWYITRTTCEPRIEKLIYYHTLKIAAEHPNVYKTLVDSGCDEFKRSLRITFNLSLRYADFFLEMWKLLNREKLSFEGALKRLYKGGKYSFIFAIKAEFEPNLCLLEELYKPFLDIIAEKSVEEAQGLIMDYLVEDRRKPKTYYDYAKKKLGIAEEIGLIPSTQKLHVTEQFMVTPEKLDIAFRMELV